MIWFRDVSDVVEGLDAAARSQLEALRAEGRFVWIDCSTAQAGADDLRDALKLPDAALQALLAFGVRGSRARKLYADAEMVVFPCAFYREESASAHRLHPVEVHLLVSRDYVLTLHQDAFSLPSLLAPYVLEGRGDEDRVFEVVQAMVATSFDALYELEVELDGLGERSTSLNAGRLRMETLRSISSRLARLRRGVAPERGLFERIGPELERIGGRDVDDQGAFDRLGDQVNRVVDGIDAAADELATVIDLRLNATIYLLTVVATVFLPLTFFTGFFGMNFKWLTDGIDTPLAFWLLGVGLLVVGVAVILVVVVRGSPVDVDSGAGTRRRGRR